MLAREAPEFGEVTRSVGPGQARVDLGEPGLQPLEAASHGIIHGHQWYAARQGDSAGSVPGVGAVGARAVAIGQQMVNQMQHTVTVIAVAMEQSGGAVQELAG